MAQGTLFKEQHHEIGARYWQRQVKMSELRKKRKEALRKVTEKFDLELAELSKQQDEAQGVLIPYVEDVQQMTFGLPMEFDEAETVKAGRMTILQFEVQVTTKNHTKRVEVEDDPDPIIKRRLVLNRRKAERRDEPTGPDVTEEPPAAAPWDGPPAGEGLPGQPLGEDRQIAEGEFTEIPIPPCKECGHEGKAADGVRGGHVGGGLRIGAACLEKNAQGDNCACKGYAVPGPSQDGKGRRKRGS